MLIAYLDEVGEPGAFIAHDHPRFKTSAGFGYAGFIIPDGNARAFGKYFVEQKGTLFRAEIEADTKGKDRNTWEIKGSDFFGKSVPDRFPERLRIFDSLVRRLFDMGGSLFYYVEEKERGTPKQVRLEREDLEKRAMKETLNRLARHADNWGENLLAMMDQINEKERLARIHNMYGHVFSRSKDFAEMKRIIEPPMHLDSSLSANIQFADWTAAIIGRAVDYHLVQDSQYSWVTDPQRLRFWVPSEDKPFTYESKLHFYERSFPDVVHRGLFSSDRPCYPDMPGLLSEENAARLRNIVNASNRRALR